MSIMKDLKPETPRFAQQGVIALGVKRTKTVNGREVEFPSDVNYFVLDRAPEIKEAYAAHPDYGPEPTELLFYFPFETIGQNMPAAHELWKGSGCHCRGDGEFIRDRLDPANGVARVIRQSRVVKPYIEENGVTYEPGQQVSCPGAEHNLYARCAACKPTTRLILIVRDPFNPKQFINRKLVYYLLSTRSVYNYIQLSGQLEMIQSLAGRMGQTLAAIPLKLTRKPQTIYYTARNKEGVEERKQVTKALLNIEVDIQWIQLASQAMYETALSAPQPLMITAGDDVIEYDPETGEILDDDAEVRRDVTPGKNGNGNGGPKRPYDPHTMKARWDEVLPVFTRNSPGPIEGGIRGLVVSKIEGFFSDDEPEVRIEKRHTFIQFLTGKISTNHFTQAEGKLMLKMLDDGNALTEVRNIVRLIESGELNELPLGADSSTLL
jgi:hypothetical protein